MIDVWVDLKGLMNSRLHSLLLSFRCACGQGADAFRRSDLSHAVPAGGGAPSPAGVRPALRHLLPHRLLRQLHASTTPQLLLQRNDGPSAPLLQPGETWYPVKSRAWCSAPSDIKWITHKSPLFFVVCMRFLPWFSDFVSSFRPMWMPIISPCFSPRSLISPIMCITCHTITLNMLPHPPVPPLIHPVSLRTPVNS